MWYYFTMKEPLIIAYGSQVRGRATPGSDFDFAVFTGKQLSLNDRSYFAGMIAEKYKINEDKIDLVDVSSISPILKFEISKYGKLVEGNEFDFIRFKVRAFKEYQDTAKFRRMRERIMTNTYVA